MKAVFLYIAVLSLIPLGVSAKDDERTEVPRGAFHLTDLEKAKAEAIKKELPLCFVVT